MTASSLPSLRCVRSPALREFWDSLKEIGTIMSIFITNERNSRDRRINESLSRSAMLLLCSHLESFLEDLVRGILKFHELSGTLSGDLPSNLKVKQILRSSDSLSLSYSGDKWKMIKRIHDHPLSNDKIKCSPDIFDVDLQIKGFASPSPNNIECLFNDAGLQQIWDSIRDWDGSDRIKKNLNVFVERRNNIAHGSSSDRPTPSDIRKMVVDMCQLVRCFNLVVVEYLIHTFAPHNLWGYSLSF
jgi:RiboL-PSP-HEPN